jgi:hypothetical protein
MSVVVSQSIGSNVCRVRVQERLGDQGGQGGLLPLHHPRRRRLWRPRAARRQQGLPPRHAGVRLLRQRRPRAVQVGGEAHDQRPPRRRPAGRARAGDASAWPVDRRRGPLHRAVLRTCSGAGGRRRFALINRAN